MKTDQHVPLNILLADDDKDDRFLFNLALRKIPIATHLTTVNNGQLLMEFLSKNSEKLPDVLFLDLNMPLKNGHECLLEIKQNPNLKQLPVIIYSTSLNEAVADVLYKNGAHYFLQKTDLTELSEPLHRVLSILAEKQTTRPAREKFVLKSRHSIRYL